MKHILILAALLPRLANALEISIDLESNRIPIYGAACGLVELSNDETSEISVNLPSMLRQTLQFEIKAGGKVSPVRSSASIQFAQQAILKLESGARVFVPFYLVKSDNKYIFDKATEFEIRAVVYLEESDIGQSPRVESSWAPCRIVEDENSTIWRSATKYVVQMNVPFSCDLSRENRKLLADTVYGCTFEMYQNDTISLVGALQRREKLDKYIPALNKYGSRVGGDIWRKFVEGFYATSAEAATNGCVVLGL